MTLEIDDATNGLSGDANLGSRTSAAVSGYPGEIAALVNNQLYYSVNYGVTWRTVGGTLNASPSTQLYWGHVGSTSVLLVIGEGSMTRADMTASSPTLTAMTDTYGNPANAFAVANGTDASWVASLESSGVLHLYRLDPTATPAETGTALSGLPSGSSLVRLGGTSSAGMPPSAAVVFSQTGQEAVMAFKDATADSFTDAGLSNTTAVSAGCGTDAPGTSPIGSIAPASGGTSATGTLGSCLVRTAGNGVDLNVDAISGINNNAGIAFDAGYGSGANNVIISADGNRGLVKSAGANGDGIPQFPSDQNASAGTAADSGGISVNGLNVAVVKDAAHGPDVGKFATMLSMSGGGLGYATDNGGASLKVVIRKGGASVAWWSGSAASDWLVYGHLGGGNLLTARAAWTSSDTPLDQPNLTNTASPDLNYSGGDPGQAAVNALEGVSGEDTVFAGIGSGGYGMPGATTGAVSRLTLAPGAGTPTVTANTRLAATDVTEAVTNLEYCPTTGSDAAVADVLFVAVDTGSAGKVVKITGATGGSPSSAVVALANPVRRIQVDCAAGTVWAGTSGGLQRSTDGGSSFSPVTVNPAGVPGSLSVTALSLNPANPSELVLAANAEGYIARTGNGGTTWTALNDPNAGGRNFTSEGINTLRFPPGAGPHGSSRAATTRSGATTDSEANTETVSVPILVGTGSGLFTTTVSSAVRGLFITNNPTGSFASPIQVPGSTTGSAAPSLVVDGTGNAAMAYAGAAGIYLSTRNNAGVWSPSRLIAGTQAGDRSPSLRRAATGHLHLAFARTTGSVGIYLMTDRTGTWSSPAKLAGTANTDASPVLVLGPGTLHVAFVRASRGVYVTTKTVAGATWAAPAARGTSSLDVAPSLAVDATNHEYLVWDRG